MSSPSSSSWTGFEFSSQFMSILQCTIAAVSFEIPGDRLSSGETDSAVPTYNNNNAAGRRGKKKNPATFTFTCAQQQWR